jgi:hypothetical protein
VGNITAVPIVAHTHMDLTHLAGVLHIHRQHVVIHTHMDLTHLAGVLLTLQQVAAVDMEHVPYAQATAQNHAVPLIGMLFVVQQASQHIITHAVKHILAQAAVLSTIHITVIFAVQHMFIVHTKAELLVLNIMLAP